MEPFLTRRSFLASSLGAALLGIAGCGASPRSVSAGTDHLTVWYWPGALSNRLLAVSAKGVPGVSGLKVVGSPTPVGHNLYTRLRTSLAARAYVPDITALNVDIASFFPHEDQFLDLNELGAETVKSQYLDWKWLGGTSPSGRLIGFPIDAGPSALFYRRDVFDQAGLPSEPDELAQAVSTWEDFFAVGRKLKAVRPNSYLTSDIATVFRMSLLQSPKQFVDQNNRFIGDQEHVRRSWNLAVEALRQGLSAKIAAGAPDLNAAVAQGRVVCNCSAVWAMFTLKQIAAESSGAWRLTRLPGGPVNYGGSYLAVTKYCRDPEGAFAFIKWLLGPQNQLAAFQEMALFPTTPAVYGAAEMRKPDPFFGGQRPMDVFGDAAEQAPVVYFSPYEASAAEPVYLELTNVEQLGKNPDVAWRDAMDSAERTLSQRGVS